MTLNCGQIKGNTIQMIKTLTRLMLIANRYLKEIQNANEIDYLQTLIIYKSPDRSHAKLHYNLYQASNELQEKIRMYV